MVNRELEIDAVSESWAKSHPGESKEVAISALNKLLEERNELFHFIFGQNPLAKVGDPSRLVIKLLKVELSRQNKPYEVNLFADMSLEERTDWLSLSENAGYAGIVDLVLKHHS